MRLLFVPVIFSIAIISFAQAPDPQAADKRFCLGEWDKTKADVESLLKRKLAMNANQIAERCAPFWASADQKALAERVRAANAGRDIQAKKREGVRLGMTPEEVLQGSWGKPTRVNRTTNAYGTNEQWVYPGQHNYLYFKNGVLTSIQN
jgi:hypothetical protein